jgi:hypothetical protein
MYNASVVPSRLRRTFFLTLGVVNFYSAGVVNFYSAGVVTHDRRIGSRFQLLFYLLCKELNQIYASSIVDFLLVSTF